MKLLYKAKSLIERDALLAELKSRGIEAISPPRDMSRKVTEATVDLSLNGYSALFDGFDILVPEDAAGPAAGVLVEFLTASAQGEAEEKTPKSDWDRFYFNAIFSLMFPLVFSAVATFYLVRAIKRGQKPTRRWRLVAAFFCFAVGWTLPVSLLVSRLGL